MGKPTCVVEGCESEQRGKSHGMCNKHRLRLQRHGDPYKQFGNKNLVRPWVHELIRDLNASGDPGRCIEWPFRKSKSGYGVIDLTDGRLMNAHRFILAQWEGIEPPAGLDCCHERSPICHNRSCVNPFHLRWDTRSGNMQDAISDGTSTRFWRGGGDHADPRTADS